MKRAEKLKRSFISMFIVSFVFVFSFGTTGKESKDVEALPLAFVVDRTKYVSMERTPTALVGKFYNECETVVTEILEPSVDAIQVTDSVLLSNGIHLMSSEYCDSTERLNLEVYAIADKAVRTHVDCVVNNETTKLGKSFGELLDPMMFLALSINEMGVEADTSFLWTPAVYAKPLSKANVNFDTMCISNVTEDTYFQAGLSDYVGCPTICSKNHKHDSGINDATSIGPLQVLREALPTGGLTLNTCGEKITDLMNWEQSIEYSIHSLGGACSSRKCWNSEYSVENEYELLALLAVAHNTGRSFLFAESKYSAAGSNWRNSEAVFEYAKVMSSDEVVNVIEAEVNSWYEDNKESILGGDRFYFPGSAVRNRIITSLNKKGIYAGAYVTEANHKFYYPLKALVNYVALNKLYEEVYGLDLYVLN